MQTVERKASIARSLQSAEKWCQAHGSRLTQKRKDVLSILLNADKAISAYELIDFFKHEFNQNMPPMSAYRILDYLVGIDLVHKIHAANKFVACAHIDCHENHDVAQLLFCQECQRVKETPINPSIYKNFKDEISNSGYQLCPQQLELTCICGDCSTRNLTL